MDNLGFHAGHRKRMRERFAADAGKSLYDHELVEILMFYAEKRKNVNPHAHALCSARGIEGFLDDTETDKVCPPAMAERLSRLIEVVNEFSALYDTDKNDCLRERRNLNSADSAKKFAVNLTAGAIREQVWVICLDNKMSLKNCFPLSDEKINENCFEKIFRLAKRCGSSNIIIVCLHLDGMSAFTRDEINAMRFRGALHHLPGISAFRFAIF